MSGASRQPGAAAHGPVSLSNPSRDKVARYRESLRRDGLRPRQFWVPDTRALGFAEEAARQVLTIAGSNIEQDVMWLDSLSVFDTDDVANAHAPG